MEEKFEKDTKKKVSFMGGNLDPVTSNSIRRRIRQHRNQLLLMNLKMNIMML